VPVKGGTVSFVGILYTCSMLVYIYRKLTLMLTSKYKNEHTCARTDNKLEEHDF